MRKVGWWTGLAVGAMLLLGAAPNTTEERLAEARNLGKAFYENPTTGAEAVAQLKKALDLAPNSDREKLNYALALLKQGDSGHAVPLLEEVQKALPSLPHTWFNLGIYYRKSGEAEKAIAQFRGMLRLTPDEPIAHYQLGALLRQSGNAPGAIAEFERAERLDPRLGAAHFQLYNLYRQSSRTADAARELAAFQAIRKQQEGAAIPEDVDWSMYSEIYDPPAAASAKQPARRPEVDQKLPGTAKEALLIDASGKGQVDLLAWSASNVSLYRRGTELATDTGLEGLRDIVHVAAGDFDNDGLMDLCVLTNSGAALFRNTGGKFARYNANFPTRAFSRAVWVDYDHDGDMDLLLFGNRPALMRNEGKAGFNDRTSEFPFVAGAVTNAVKERIEPDSKSFDLAVYYRDRQPVMYRDRLGGKYETEPLTAAQPADLFTDFVPGTPVRVHVAEDGSIHEFRSPPKTHWIGVRLAGIRSPKLAQDAQVEIKAGTLYNRRMYDGVPLFFDIGDYENVDVVRITWPNGLIQNETRQPANKLYRYEEAQRLSGSCPMIWTWDGKGFQFISDVLGVAPLGASDGEGGFFPVNHVEHVMIPGSSLKTVDGRFDVRLTEELSEVTYLDQVRLYAIDHAAGTDVFTNDKFQSPPFPGLAFYNPAKRIYPLAAREGGHDVLGRVVRKDGLAPDTFPRTSLGVAGMHTLELDFGKAASNGTATLLLNGWVDWADGSVFRAASQEGDKGLVMPYLQMQDSNGEWKTVNEDMGLPSGKPKTIAVDLKFISSSRKVRIVTNLCIYWDEIFLSESATTDLHPRTMTLTAADLHFRGFSKATIDPTRLKPDTYQYGVISSTTFWNPTPGFYTRYGAVQELVGAVDDKLVIMGSGDELKLSFAALSPPQPGFVRDYLLEVDGWAKDSDPNTAFSSTVEPLPFHGMSGYPYRPSEHYPDDEAHNRYRREYNTRPALRLIRPLSE